MRTCTVPEQESGVLITVLKVDGGLDKAEAQRVSNYFSFVAVYYEGGKEVFVGGHQPEDNFKKLFPNGGFAIEYRTGRKDLPLSHKTLLAPSTRKLDLSILTPWRKA
jgi:hypothetical protein